MIRDVFDMDTQEKIRYVSESSNTSTSGYSTISQGSVLGAGSSFTTFGANGRGEFVGNISPSSSNNTQYSISPSTSPVTAALQMEFSNLNLPSILNSPLNQIQQTQLQNSPQYNQLQMDGHKLMGAPTHQPTALTTNNMYRDHLYFSTNSTTNGMHFDYRSNNLTTNQNPNLLGSSLNAKTHLQNASGQEPYLHISEQPVDKFRFRYKSEMHGTHGSLNGCNSKRTPKTFPEVELRNFKGPAVIRCSLFQTNLESPHSHQLVVRKDDRDICDPHDLHVSQEKGYVAQFMNMGIIHTAKKFIYDELLKKKEDRLVFQMGRRELSTKQKQELHQETEREAKDMNLNQVRLCFEAFTIEHNIWIPITKPVYTNAINNRKSAQTGELRIVRLSIAAGSVNGNDELILLVEKVSKKNIKVRFFEQNEDDETVWEAYAKFRESDVHHQYAIVCQTPPYKDKDIDQQVEVSIELIRPSDDERSFPPLIFRYKPRDAVTTRKRRRTGSTMTSSSGTGSANSSMEIPKPVEEQAAAISVGTYFINTNTNTMEPPTISEEYNKDQYLRELLNADSNTLKNYFASGSFTDYDSMLNEDLTQKDGVNSTLDLYRNKPVQRILPIPTELTQLNVSPNSIRCFHQILEIYNNLRSRNFSSPQHQHQQHTECAKKVEQLYLNHADKNYNGDTLLHEVIVQKNEGLKWAKPIMELLKYFKLQSLINGVLNANNQSLLHYACLHECDIYVRPLLGLGANPHLQDNNGNTALHIAVKEQHENCINSILQMNDIKFDLTLKNDDGLTPLHIAIMQNNFEVAKKLIKYDRNAIHVSNTKNGNNALHMAVEQQTRELIILILDAHNMEQQDILLARNAAGNTALDLAKQLSGEQKNAIVQLLEPLYKPLAMHIVQIKEELESSSDDENSNETIMDYCSNSGGGELPQVKTEIKVKDEYTETMTMDTTGEPNDGTQVTQDLAIVLNDDNKFKALVKLLEQKDENQMPKWKQLAEKSKMHHLTFLWKNAEAMLKYVKTKSSNIEYSSFARALAQVDLDALHVLQKT